MIPALLAVFVAGVLLGSAWPSHAVQAALATAPAADSLVALTQPVSGRESAQDAAHSAEPARLAVPASSTAMGDALPPAEIARRAASFTVYLQGADTYGAGVLLDEQGHVVTCAHVIEGLQRVDVSFADGTTLPARVVETDPALDLALLRVEAGRRSQLSVASVASVEIGDELFTMGAPRKMAFSFNRGMASFVGRPFEGVRYLQTDLALNGGSSGGPVMNSQGQVVALSSFVLRDSEGIAFALPIDYAYERFARHLASTPADVAADGFAAWRDARKPAAE